MPLQRTIGKTRTGPVRVPAPTELDLDRILGAGAIGGGLAAEVEAAASAPMPTMTGTPVTSAGLPGMSAGIPVPAVSVPTNSPMFSLPTLSQQDLERCLEKAVGQ